MSAIDVSTPLIEEEADGYARVVLAPLPHDLALVLGTALRRTLLSAIPGAAITSARIDGVAHEFSTIEHVFEDVPALLSNLQGVRFRMFAKRPARLFLDVQGEHEVLASDISQVADYEIVNPAARIALLADPSAALTVDMVVEPGRGFSRGEDRAEHLPIGTLPLDALFSPILRVNVTVSPAPADAGPGRQLVIEVWTDRTIGGVAALRAAAGLLDEAFAPLAQLAALDESSAALFDASSHGNGATPVVELLAIDELGLTARTANALRRAQLLSVGDLVARSERDLMSLSNFGVGSLAELRSALAVRGVALS